MRQMTFLWVDEMDEVIDAALMPAPVARPKRRAQRVAA